MTPSFNNSRLRDLAEIQRLHKKNPNNPHFMEEEEDVQSHTRRSENKMSE